MASHKILAAFAALAMVIGSEASPCRPISSVVTSATLPSAVTASTATATIDATSTFDFTSAATTYATDVTIIEIETASTEATTDAPTVIESTTEIASTTTAAGAPIETLFITNGEFETGNVAPWASSGIAAVVNVVNSQSHEGSSSLAIGSQASDSIFMSQTLDKSLLVAMQPYKLSLYAKVSDAVKCSNGITMFFDNGSQQSPFETSVYVPGSQLADDWTYVSGEFTFTEAELTGNGIIRFVFKTRCSNGYFAYVDDIKMELAN